ncbi:MAG TPA: phosphoribosylanthranilate isomerase [Thermoanaerobaculia bacterium]|jgi:phosphoribosylanthranilate isomerase|nr:phosphoribosylanthranilate isomerase [Thermoanaerobaculia bacterium]
MTKIKICGITRAEDAELAIELGADYLGFIFVSESPRHVVQPPRTERVKRVGVFRGASRDEILRTIDAAKLDMVQIHGDAIDLGIPMIRAFKVEDTLPDTNTRADYILFDTGGGTGRVFDWDLLAGYDRTKPFFLAGGITPDNVAEAIVKTNPYAIDVASGVEERPGVKDHGKLRALFEAIHR